MTRNYQLAWLLVTLSVGWVGCDGSDTSDEPVSVVGTWTLESVNGLDLPADVLVLDHPDSGETFRIDEGSATFRSDDTWSMSLTIGGETGVFSGTYTLSGRVLSINWTAFPDPDDDYDELVRSGVWLSAELVSGAVNFVILLHDNPHATLRFTRE